MRRGDLVAARGLRALAVSLLLAACDDGAMPAPRDATVSDASDAPDVITGDSLDVSDASDVSDALDVVDARDVAIDVTPPVITALAGRARPISPWFFGLDGSAAQRPPWGDSAFTTALAELRPATLRFPGGAAANWWDWGRGTYQTGFTPLSPMPARLDALAATLAATMAAPVFTLNVVSAQGRIATASDEIAMVSYQHALLAYARAMRMPVLFVELGDGLDLDAPGPAEAPPAPYTARFATGADYGRAMNIWIVPLRQGYPDAQFAVVASTSEATTRAATWNASLLDTVRGVDAVTVRVEIPVRDGALSDEAALALPFAAWRDAERLALTAARARSLDAWVSAAGLRDLTTDHAFESTWLQGLVSATLALLELAEPTVTRATVLSTTGAADVAALFPTTYAIGAEGAHAVSLGRSASAAVLAVLSRATANARAARTIDFADAPTLHGDPALLGAQITAGDGGQQALVVNLSPRALAVDLSAIAPASRRYEQLSARSLRTRVTGAASGELVVATGDRAATMTLTPRSVTRIFP